jgi:hypothetical protein
MTTIIFLLLTCTAEIASWSLLFFLEPLDVFTQAHYHINCQRSKWKRYQLKVKLGCFFLVFVMPNTFGLLACGGIVSRALLSSSSTLADTSKLFLKIGICLALDLLVKDRWKQISQEHLDA